MTNRVVSRRGFLRSGVAAGIAAGFPTIIPASAIGRGGRAAPSERITVGCIGVGDRGSYLMGATLQLPDVQVCAVADVKRDRREAAKAAVDGFYENSGCSAYNEFEAITHRDDIDACIIASCDHWHVLHALSAVRAGKDVYVEKPLGISLEQDQALRKAVRRHKRIFQFGTQQRSDERFRRACELVLNGRIGELKTINVWSPASVSGGPTNEVPVPETLDYDRWLGPAPKTPYTYERDTNKWWWFISEYAIGFIAGWGIHPIDIALWGAGKLVETPVHIKGTGTFPSEGVCNTATSWDIACAYDSGVAIRYRSEPALEEWKSRYGQISGHGTAFEGTKGWVHVNRNVIRSSPENIVDSVIQSNEIRLIKSEHHMRNFFDSVKSRRDPISPIESAVNGDMLCQVCDVAIRLNREVYWDTKKEQFIDDREANKRLQREMRAPWQLARV
ncbi:MAG: Gfo/Idh/MocA family oxidoreductase [Candidatus Hydrogenedentes bacterium]|nr:Gfo/Idh/MocA family oxidoreductase [Candidatus Hydrogenedentota bacterium]